jgi:predicted TIM-barrel fold metal-dependent hydrolase
MGVTRRTVLRLLTSAPLVATAACCTRQYPKREIDSLESLKALPAPQPREGAAIARRGPIIDVHAHFFNASDVPVRGFLAECIAHGQPQAVEELLKVAAHLAEGLAGAAPTAAEELRTLRKLAGPEAVVPATLSDPHKVAKAEAAQRLAETIRNSDFERLYRRMKQSAPLEAPGAARTGPLSSAEIEAVVDGAEQPSPAMIEAVPAAARDDTAAAADGVLGFLKYMVSPRWANVQTYMQTFTRGPHAFGIDHVLGALVDFDYWLDCPPHSAHDDQVALHQQLFELHRTSSPKGAPYFFPVVAYNPWTDIEQDGGGLRRVVDAFTHRHFVAVKIYPPTGFRPAGNGSIPKGELKKRHPDIKTLDATLEKFFETCATMKIPVLAHAAPSNGRDQFHDDYSGPQHWEALLARYASRSAVQIVDFGHFGGGRRNWTADFASLMSRKPAMSLYGDLGYWDELMCGTESDDCTSARLQLGKAMKVPIPGTSDTVLDRVMFATDWLMLSQVKRWSDYPRLLRESLTQIPDVDEESVSKVFGGNALKCFSLPIQA